ncbi:phage portal protein [Mesorhizobium sp. NBSH29]|uniref:phage portal protein n=1 Tax=Mesorhizobium sp. NBSH29 TaxID=2654249 RepID=UPI0018969DA7|nr:phage portal protein [Mesorhizobium sp. NBSH29]
MGAKRASYRKQIDLIESARAYDGASRSRRTAGWGTSKTAADAELSKAGAILLERSRDLVRNNPYATKIVAAHADNIIGTGIVPRANTGSPDLDAKINKMFDNWSRRASIEGVGDFYGMQYLACREMVEGGDVLARRLYIKSDQPVASSKPEDQISPLRIRILEAEYLDSAKNVASGSGIIVNGVEMNKDGSRKGYWLFQQHPGASVQNAKLGRESKRFPAEDIAHLYEMQRQQARGAPWLAPIMVSMKDLDDYNQAELIRKKLEACMVGVVIPGEDEDAPIGIDESGAATGITDADGFPIERFEPGMFAYMHGGRDIKFNNPAISAGIESYIRVQLRRLASGARIPYELVTGDLSQANYSSNRMGMMQYRRFVEHVQYHMIIPLFCQPIWEWFIESLWLMNAIPKDTPVPVNWSPPAHAAINPVEDAKADILEVRAGFRSMPEVIGSRGRVASDVIKENIEWNTAIDAAGLILDTDPRNVSMNGQIQFEASGTDDKDGGGETSPDTPAAKSGKLKKQGKPDGKKS